MIVGNGGFFYQSNIVKTMRCDTCKFKSIYIGAGAPDDYSMDYCSKEHWEGPPDEVIENDNWANCADYRCKNCGGSLAVEIGDGEYSTCPCAEEH